jgi:hypothetical protein
MGYDLHITRKEDWFSETGPDITHSEWECYISEDPSVIHDPQNDNKSYLILRESGSWPLWWKGATGEIYTKNPEIDVVVKMVAIAEQLGAKVQGDDGEVYNEKGEFSSSELREEGRRMLVNQKPWWKFWT